MRVCRCNSWMLDWGDGRLVGPVVRIPIFFFGFLSPLRERDNEAHPPWRG